MRDEWMGLSEAALRLHLSYHRALRLVLIGRLGARKADNGRWWIRCADVERMAREGIAPDPVGDAVRVG